MTVSSREKVQNLTLVKIKNAVWTADRLNFYAAMLCSVLLVICWHSWQLDHAAQSLIKRGDFPAFYAAGHLAAGGSTEQLYSLDLQADIQNRFWPSLNGSFHVFAYPPLFGSLCSLLARFDPLTAKLMELVFALLLLGMAICLGSKTFSLESQKLWLPLFTLALLFPPLFVGTLGGQNTALSLLILALTSELLLRERALTAGFVSAFWLFKPQYGCLAAPFFFLCASDRVSYLLGFVATTLMLFSLNTVCFGVGWLQDWISALGMLGGMNDLTVMNQRIIVSLPGFVRAVSEQLLVSPSTARSLAISVLVVGYVATAFFLQRRLILSKGLALALVGPLVVLLSPQTAFYDLGIAILPVLSRVRPEQDRSFWQVWVLWSLAAICQLLQPYASIPLMFILTPLLLLFAVEDIFYPRSDGQAQ